MSAWPEPVRPGALFAFYGLLLAGAAGAPEGIDLAGAGAYLGPCWLAGDLVDCGGFPGLIRGTGRVLAERYRVDDPAIVAALDAFEDVVPGDPAASLYRRERVGLLDATGASTGETAWAYLYNRAADGLPRLTDGVWPLDRGNRSE